MLSKNKYLSGKKKKFFYPRENETLYKEVNKDQVRGWHFKLGGLQVGEYEAKYKGVTYYFAAFIPEPCVRALRIH